MVAFQFSFIIIIIYFFVSYEFLVIQLEIILVKARPTTVFEILCYVLKCRVLNP